MAALASARVVAAAAPSTPRVSPRGARVSSGAAPGSRRRRPRRRGARARRPNLPVTQQNHAARRALLLLLRAAPEGDDEYYSSWSKYPDDPNIPPEITSLLREVGDGDADVWATKPPWCQPWTIVMTGAMIVCAPTAVFGWKWASAFLTLPIGAWWFAFLIAYPKQFREYVEIARGYYDRPRRE
tara:strand:- start:132 stop:683 length:552 start_codon:yes stop_codon:yes gene_type:complete